MPYNVALLPVVTADETQLLKYVEENFRRIANTIALPVLPDSLVSVPASKVTAGTFAAGDFTFPSDLTVTDTLLVGTAKMGASGAHAGSGWAEWSHSSQWSGGPGSGSSYGFLHNSNGEILVNATSGQTASIRVAGNNEAVVSSVGLNVIDKLSVGNSGAFDSEAITVGDDSGLSGISFKDRADSAKRWVIYPDNQVLYLWNSVANRTRAACVEPGGEGVFGLGYDGETHVGPWLIDRAYSIMGSRVRANANNLHYMVLGRGTGDANTYVAACGPGGDIVFREANNGSDIVVMKPGSDFRCNLPSVGGPDPTVHISAASSQFLRNSSALKYKTSIKKIEGTNPIWSVRPVNYKWRESGPDAVINAKEKNREYPEGIPGFVADELAEVSKDLVTYDGDGNPATPHTWGILAYVVAGLQELKSKVDVLEKK
jgi:hypothetical protein